jgi:alanine racemase
VGAERKIFAVIKADGYGHGAGRDGARSSSSTVPMRSAWLISERHSPRRRGITAPVLVYPNSLPEGRAGVPRPRPHSRRWWTGQRAGVLGGGVGTLRRVRQGSTWGSSGWACRRAGRQDGGGHDGAAAPALAGLCAHPHASDGDAAYAEWQLGRFTAVSTSCEARGIPVPVRLLAASPFVLRFPQTYLNAVDPGRMLYGITFPGETSPLPLRPRSARSPRASSRSRS